MVVIDQPNVCIVCLNAKCFKCQHILFTILEAAAGSAGSFNSATWSIIFFMRNKKPMLSLVLSKKIVTFEKYMVKAFIRIYT